MKLFIFLLIFTLEVSAQAVVNGELASSSSYGDALRSVLALKIRYSPCSGTYLGKGRILTAAHCLLLDGYPDEKAPICIQDGLGSSLGCLNPQDYTVSFPQKEQDGPKAPVRGGSPGSSKVIRIPIPDMAMIVMNREFNIPAVTLALKSEQHSPAGGDPWIAGQGCNHYETFEGREVMRLGKVALDSVADRSVYFMTWRPNSERSGACPGDSGGPLFLWGSRGEILQIGVISYIQRKFDQNGLTSVVNAFGRIDGLSASSWLQD